MPVPFPIGVLTLARAQVGERLRVVTICPDCPECVRLRELGFQDRMEVRKISERSDYLFANGDARGDRARSREHVRVERSPRVTAGGRPVAPIGLIERPAVKRGMLQVLRIGHVGQLAVSAASGSAAGA